MMPVDSSGQAPEKPSEADARQPYSGSNSKVFEEVATIMSAQGLPSVLAFERYDPTGASLDWLRERGVNVIFGNALWEMPCKRFTEDELIARHMAVSP
ncbi:hypothetical protein [Mesorhizobium sp. W067]